ncbi:MAG TPA: hypothetical protein VM578_03425 [Candidatus Saccharimonadales bacterium]|nr:hypothetical protein [Candidatus Saccharimonadales bacterium]
MKDRYLVAVSALMLLVPSLVMGQELKDGADDNASIGRVWGNYTVQQSVEFGGRITDTSGNVQMYDTLVDLHGGPRLLGQELTIRPITRGGGFFDSLYMNSFGFGGDPDNVARLRIEKSKWYNFVALYRRNKNIFNDNLFANPLTLNPGITNCSTVTGGAVNPCTAAFSPQANYFYTNSPHQQATTRNMGDFNLTLFPQSVVRVRLGFARNDNKGRVDSSLEDVNIDLTQQSKWRSDRLTFGVDVRLLPRTTLSFDQFFERDKVDTAYVNNPVNPYTLGVGGPGVSIPLYFPPCSVVVGGIPQPYITAPGVLNPLCNTGVFGYSRRTNVRSFFPTSQVSFQSNYFRKLDVTGSGTYSSGNSKLLNYNELFFGLVARTNNTAFQVSGPGNTNRVSGSADLGITYHFTRSLSISDKFHWLDWRDPGATAQLTTNCFSNKATGETLSTPTGAPCGVPGISTLGFAPAGLTASSLNNYNTLEGERRYFNTTTLHWTPSRLFGAYAGYRYGRRELKTNFLEVDSTTSTLAGGLIGPATVGNPSGGDLSTDRINLHAGLFGIVVRPTNAWRINIDTELQSGDNAFTEIAPRHEQRVRANTVLKLNRWSSINGGVHFIESRNDWAENFGGFGVNLFPVAYPRAYGTQSHNRYYTVGASLKPTQRVGVDFGWTYMDQKFSIPACMVLSSATIVAGGAPARCPVTTNQPSDPVQFNITANQFTVPLTQAYEENTHTGYAILTVRPVHRVTLHVGYDLTSTNGNDKWLRADNQSPLQVLGDAFGNSPGIPGNPGTVVTGATTSAGSNAFLGPFPNQPLGSQVFNWHVLNAGIGIEVAKGIMFKGNYGYYDYNEKEGNISPNQLVTLPRNFRANMGTLALRYSF